jgi:hypothetical protein
MRATVRILRFRTTFGSLAVAACVAALAGLAHADEPPRPAAGAGAAIYREHCVRCHGDEGAGTKAVPDPLVGERSINQLAAYIDETMPEDDPDKVSADQARHVAEYIHAAFYSPVARDRNRPARVELSRLTVRQYENVAADLFGSFRGTQPGVDDRRGLRAEYFSSRTFDWKNSLVFQRIDPDVDFDFGLEGPDPEQFRPNRFAIRWAGSIVPPETGVYEFVLRSDQAVRLALNTAWYEPELIDATVKSGDDTEFRARVRLLGGRAYPLRLEFSKASQGVDSDRHEHPRRASIRLMWKPPHGVLEPVPSRVLIPADSPQVFVLNTPFPPDDRSIGYERGTSVSQEWFAASTAAAVEIADYALAHIEHLARVKRDAPDRAEKLRQFARMFAERAIRRPLSPELETLFIERPFADAPDLDAALKRSLLLVLGSPRFLFREAAATAGASADDGFATAARLSFGLWDSIPDQQLRDAAARNQLATAKQVRAQAERMVNDRRTRAKVRDFLFTWLRLDQGPEIVKDTTRFSEFSTEIAADMRTSLELFLDDAVWGTAAAGDRAATRSDFRRLFLDDEVYVNGRLGPFLGVSLRPDAPFRRVRLDDGRRAGVLSHPYMASVLSYAGSTSPIHRGVFLARGVLGNVLKPPTEAIAPLAPDLHPTLSTRERVTLQTSSVACQTCHTMINPLGFALEEFDPVGRHRTAERRGDIEKPIDASGSYLPRDGDEASFRGARELAAVIVGSRDAQEAFVRNLFHAVVKQPPRAWGSDTVESLRASFVAAEFDIRRLLVDIIVTASVPPPASATAAPPPGSSAEKPS